MISIYYKYVVWNTTLEHSSTRRWLVWWCERRSLDNSANRRRRQNRSWNWWEGWSVCSKFVCLRRWRGDQLGEELETHTCPTGLPSIGIHFLRSCWFRSSKTELPRTSRLLKGKWSSRWGVFSNKDNICIRRTEEGVEEVFRGVVGSREGRSETGHHI